MKFLVLCLIVAVSIYSVLASQRYPSARRAAPPTFDDTIAEEGQHYQSHHGHHQGRVQIKTYRGPTASHGHGWFAPFGFWVRQPHDNQGWSR